MKRIALVVLGIALLGACGNGGSTTAAPAPTVNKTLNLVISDEKATVHEVVDLGKKGFGFGDQIVEVAAVLDSAGAEVGNSYTTVAVVTGTSDTDFGGLLICSFMLKDGRILFSGAIDAKDFGTGVDVPVVGGTGAYKSATGVVKLVVPDAKRTNATFSLTLPK